MEMLNLLMMLVGLVKPVLLDDIYLLCYAHPA
jgi:hypothetical protein